MRVEITEANFRHCRCPKCPVQMASKCSAALIAKDTAETSDIRLFCATGKTKCDDFDTNQHCVCPTCLVWDENNLNSAYYCQSGEAK